MTYTDNNPVASEYQPEWRLVYDERPLLNKTLLLYHKDGTAYKGTWQPEQDIVAWCPMPDLTRAQKDRLETLKAQNKNIFAHHTKQHP